MKNSISTPRFDRHEHMSSETRKLILNSISTVKRLDGSYSLENMLYGLFDGYNYSEEILAEIETLVDTFVDRDNIIYQDIVTICNTVNEYPEITYTNSF